MISKQMFSLNLMFLCWLIEELCTKEENDKTGCNFNFEHQYICVPKIYKHTPDFKETNITSENKFSSSSNYWKVY